MAKANPLIELLRYQTVPPAAAELHDSVKPRFVFFLHDLAFDTTLDVKQTYYLGLIQPKSLR